MSAAAEENFREARNPRHLHGIRTSTRPGAGSSEGFGPNPLGRGSERAATNRESEPGPHTIPISAAAPNPPERGGRGQGKLCRQCRVKKPRRLFPMLDHKKSVEHDYATRHWCGCLIARGHITERYFEKFLQAFDAAEEERKAAEDKARAVTKQEHAAAKAARRRHRLAVSLIDRAVDDPVFARALQDAAKAAKRARQNVACIT